MFPSNLSDLELFDRYGRSGKETVVAASHAAFPQCFLTGKYWDLTVEAPEDGATTDNSQNGLIPRVVAASYLPTLEGLRQAIAGPEKKHSH